MLKTHKHFQLQKSEIKRETNLLFLLPARVIFFVVKNNTFYELCKTTLKKNN